MSVLMESDGKYGQAQEISSKLWLPTWDVTSAVFLLVGYLFCLNFPNINCVTGTEVERQLQVVIASLRLINADLNELKSNISGIVNATEINQNIKEVFQTPAQNDPSSCLEVKKLNSLAPSGVYLVSPKGESFMVYCEMDFQSGGWLTIHNRFTGEQDFYKNWEEYRTGFGNLAGEHWLGLDKIHQLTGTWQLLTLFFDNHAPGIGKEINELAVELMDVNNARTHAIYDLFSIGSEQEGYALKVLGSYTGSAGDSMSYHAGSKFSTKDRDQDGWSEGNCAQSHGNWQNWLVSVTPVTCIIYRWRLVV